ncbi:oxidoreductase [Nocardia asteroides]|uniref:oxidoreductase n=1 Tax=Nocardia asteroides TaxID=1824 RepID=UPI001E464E8B|nr:oxidoreductase [Nocardia asteroides]UGT55142.1 SDR family NAD(P)-dependent oxidoreductase [Nocardia asteroides]
MTKNESTRWNALRIPDLTGRTAVVTGANSGLGLATVEALARAGANVVLAVRNPLRGEEAVQTVTGARGPMEVRPLDLTDLSSINQFASEWEGNIDLLINNAGIMNVPESSTKDGFELQLGTNHLGHFTLTNLLLPYITDRVVTVSSLAHKASGARIHFDNLNLTGEYAPFAAYGQSKLANLLFTLELQRRLTAAGSPVRSLAAHPGYSNTSLNDNAATWIMRVAGRVINRLYSQDPTMGALPTLFAAVQDLPGASFVGPDGAGERRGYPTLVGRSANASDPATARRLWELSEALTGTSFPDNI